MASKSKNNPNDDLVDALESIRGLLEKSETKLSAARQSLAQAKSTPVEPRRSATSKKYKRPPVSTEPIVPVLDDIVFEDDATDNDTTLNDIPTLDFGAIVSRPKAKTTPPPAPAPLPKTPSGPSTKAILAYIDKFEALMEQRIHDALLDTLVKVELEIKTAVEEELKTLRKMITGKK